MADFQAGRRIAVQWESRAEWQYRIVLGPCSVADFESIMETKVRGGARAHDRLQYCLTPDLDLYPHHMASPPLTGLVVFNNQGGTIARLCSVCWFTVRSAEYGSDWQPTPLEVCEAIAACLPTEGGGTGSGREPPLTPPKVPSDFEFVEGGTLAEVEGRRWFVLSTGEDLRVHAAMAAPKFDAHCLLGDLVLGVRNGAATVLRLADPQALPEELETDLRLHPIAVNDLDGRRHRRFQEAVGLLTETDHTGWPALGPRTVKWCLNFLGQQDGNPRARHTKWKHECGLSATDDGVGDHDLCMRMFEMGLVFDQVNLSELGTFELVARRAQMAEWRHRERILGQHDELFDDQFLYMGAGETRGLLMVCPDLQDHINQELHREANVLKEKRKVREERLMSRGSGSGGGAGGGHDLQRKVETQAAELKRLQARLADKKTGENPEADEGRNRGRGGGRGR